MIFVKKFVSLIVVLFIVTALTSLLVGLLPGDAARAIQPFATDAQLKPLRAELGLDKSIPARYADWLDNAVHGDLGNYYNAGGGRQPVWNRIKDALPISLELMILAQILSLAIAVPLGVISAYRAGKLVDKTITTGAFAAIAFPSFALALALSYFFGVKRTCCPRRATSG